MTVKELQRRDGGPVWLVPIYQITGHELLKRPQYAVAQLDRHDADLVHFYGIFGSVTFRFSEYRAKWISFTRPPEGGAVK